VGELTERLENCATGGQNWVKENSCQFYIEKTEAMLFTRRRRNRESKMRARVTVSNH